MGVNKLPKSIHELAADDGIASSPTDGSAGESSMVPSAMTMARLLLLVKENQLLTAAVLFAAWQAGIFLEAWYTIQGVCNA